MNHSYSSQGTNMDIRPSYESDQADDDLQQIIECKKELFSALEYASIRFGNEIHLHEMRSEVQEAFDDAFHYKWHTLRDISGSIGWPIDIPSFETLSFATPKQNADHKWKKRQPKGE